MDAEATPLSNDEMLASLARELLPFLRHVNVLRASYHDNSTEDWRSEVPSVGTALELSPGVLLPTSQTTLTAIQEQFLSIFDVPAIFTSEKLPSTLTQPDRTDTDPFGTKPYPIPGNDFHAEPSITYDLSAWSSLLQLHSMDRSTKHLSPLVVPLDRIGNHPDLTPSRVLEVAESICKLWPDSHIAPVSRRLLGPRFNDSESVEYRMISWLASKDVNLESVRLDMLLHHPSGYYLQSQGESKASIIADGIAGDYPTFP
ncbi:hypothetical protein BKA67DRAFT_580717 [Truncatella angustata]|uniref:Uncharacterized protein n=1 Tax=Truncatella angustata TaxID=152316 RepID=A0A9P8RMQ7_9PEZI|nr:uncharacterized protein BKA67DRAFT_580717 [Truncatella angustata]KAH6646846.1 hypothetical protein BKA67DRAFT_580717 [Truncatella angustata]